MGVGMGVCLCLGRACLLSLVWVASLVLRVFVLPVRRLSPLRGWLTHQLLPLGPVPLVLPLRRVLAPAVP
jgi:hypothetical protein